MATKTTKFSMLFTPDDIRLVNIIRRQLEATQGKVSTIAVIRAALRKAVAK